MTIKAVKQYWLYTHAFEWRLLSIEHVNQARHSALQYHQKSLAIEYLLDSAI